MTRRSRDWLAAREKVDHEGKCRVCRQHAGPFLHIEAAHVMGRRHDPTQSVRPEDVVPLCRECHRLYDAHALDLLPHLSYAEQAAAVELVGMERARVRIVGAPPSREPKPAYAGN